VLLDGPAFRCPANAVLGYGTARADVRLADGEVIAEYATLTLMTGPPKRTALGLAVHVEGEHPFGGTLVYGGEASPAAGPFGGALAVRLPQIPSLAGLAVVALSHLRLVLGSRQITHTERAGRRIVRYHPQGSRYRAAAGTAASASA
jgi:hypothetical protein